VNDEELLEEVKEFAKYPQVVHGTYKKILAINRINRS